MAYAPTLTESQLERVRVLAKPRQVAAGDVLYNPNDDTPPVYVVIEGKIRIVSMAGGVEDTVALYDPGQFSGELLMIAGRRSIYRCQAVEASRLLELSAENLRTLISKDAELSEIFMRTFLARRLSMSSHGRTNVLMLGSRYSARTLALREFLTRDGHPFAYVDLDTDHGSQELLDRFQVSSDDVPIVICNGEQILRSPSTRELAHALGFNSNIDTSQVRDIVVVGAGPAGLAAAVYAASEGLDVLVIERTAPGGQAGSSSRIENYLGFPTGLSGQELANSAIAQSEKFGAKIMVARTVQSLNCDERPYRITLDDGQQIRARSIVLATGATYNQPALPNIDRFAGCGIYYNATFMEGQLCRGEPAIVIGGGNSAGQAAVFLAQNTKGVRMLVRSAGLAATMSRYLIRRIEENPLIQIHFDSELVNLVGGDHLEEVSWRDKTTGEVTTQAVRHVFVMAGASPKTGWLAGCLSLDSRGFVLTGTDLDDVLPPRPWPLARRPYMLETSLPGVFAVGDARSGNVKRVAAAVGEGSIVVHMVHQVLADM
ncbi:MAG TPA: FAD-dependent oxidoreductase [Paraburkholderia sp.]|uniref:FAD-dependent oxidoreductase n=1 Tax=Paraburkholderia sp. TaxID=1926495 RepID=UPI002BA07F81|nr:FAD-dependent oxidoreductase [Paraburkholderia sp.]HTR07400.1 FAD-dependent oxidoreductase [Paraburkholderia sp.]